MPEHILCGTDFSKGASWAFERAILIADACRLPVRLVHVAEDLNENSAKTATLEEALAYQANACARRNLVIETSVIQGKPRHSLVEQGMLEGCRLLVVGPRSQGDVRSWFLGSTVEGVVQASMTPVLSVHAPPEGRYQRILAALDLENASLASVANVRSLGLCPPAEFAVVHAFQPLIRRIAFIADMASEDEERMVEKLGNEALSRILDQIESVGYGRGTIPTFIEDGDPYPVIQSTIQRWQADLLVLGSHGRGPIAELFLGSTARSALREAPCDVLVQRLA